MVWPWPAVLIAAGMSTPFLHCFPSALLPSLCPSGKAHGLKVTQLFPEEGNLGLVLPTSLSKWTMDKVRQEGVTVLPGTTVSQVVLSEEEGKVVASLSDGNEVGAYCMC